MESVFVAIHETHQSFKGWKKKHMIKWKVFLWPSMKHTNQSQRVKKTHDQMESVFMSIHETHQSQRVKKKNMIKWKVFFYGHP